MTSAGQTTRQAPSVTIVICTYYRPALLEQCLRAAAGLNYPNFTVSVIDNAQSSGEAKQLAARFGADYLHVPSRGLSRARNAGARRATGDFVAFLDDDMVPHVDWLASMMDEFRHERIMAVSGPVLPSAMFDANPSQLQTALQTRPWGVHRFQTDRESPEWFERDNFGGAGDGNMILRRVVIDQIAGFEERLGRGASIPIGEEHYAYFKILSMGHRLAYAPHGIVFHPDRPETRESRRRRITEVVAYSTFLAANHPRYCGRLAIFLLGALVGRHRSWRVASTSKLSPVSMREVTQAFLSGILAGWRSARETTKTLHENALVAPSQSPRD